MTQNAVAKPMSPMRWASPPNRSWQHECVFRTLDAGMQASWVLGDSVYGSHRPLRKGLEGRSQAYALAVACKEKVEVDGTRKRVDLRAGNLTPANWQRLSAGDGSKGPRLFDWAWIQITGTEKQGWKRWLVVRRSLVEGPKPAELAYFLIFAPSTTTLAEIVLAIGSRWTVEQCFEEAKGEVGLDEYEVRSFQGWYRHITLSMLAHAFLTLLRAQSQAELSETTACEEKKRLLSSPSHTPSQTLSDFKRQRGLLYPSSSH